MDNMRFEFEIDGDDFQMAGEASGKVKKSLKQMGFSVETAKRVSIAMYEGEINMVIHANGGKCVVEVFPDRITVTLADTGPGIPDIDLAMKEGYSTATEEVRQLGFGAGMGLPNMRKYADELSIDSKIGEGTTVFMAFNA